jgi:hypothetical protein
MGPARKHELDKRLADYSATLRSSRLEETRKQRSGNWQIYAAVTVLLVGWDAAKTGRSSIR